MPWELTVVKTLGPPPEASPEKTDTLGSLEAVQSQLSIALNGIEFYKEPSGAEKLVVMKEKGIDVPESLRNIFASTMGSFRGVYKGEGFSFEFSFGHETLVDYAFLDVRGNGDPMSGLARIMEVTGWAIYDLATSKMVVPSGWSKFTEWRDLCIASAKANDDS